MVLTACAAKANLNLMNVATSIIVLSLPDDQEGNTVVFQHSESYLTIKAALQDELKEIISCSVGSCGHFLSRLTTACERNLGIFFIYLFFFVKDKDKKSESSCLNFALGCE